MAEPESLNLTSDESRRLQKAFQDKEFLKLFEEYLNDVNDVDNQRKYEEEIISIEKDRGFDVKFIHPDPVYVMKFVTGKSKFFINVCKNRFVKEPEYERKNGGTEWKIPVILSKPREDLDKKRSKCTVMDVMFHPKTIDLAAVNTRIKDLVEDTAVSMVSERFSLKLDVKSALHPKMKYKGKAPKVILRQNVDKEYVCEPIEDYFNNFIANERNKADTGTKSSQSESKMDSSEDKQEKPKSTDLRDNSKSKTDSKEFKLDEKSLVTKMPSYTIKYRNVVDLTDYSLMGYTDKAAPKEIIIEFQLPGVEKASEVQIDVFEKKLKLTSCPGMKHNYLLEIALSYCVDKGSGKAKFIQAKNLLNVTLPVKDRGIPKQMNCPDKDDVRK